MDEAQRPTTPVQFDIDLHHYRQLIQNLPRLVPTSNHIGSFNKARYGVHDDTQFEKIYTYVAKGLDLAETRDVCFDLWVQNTSLEVIKKLLGEPWVLEEGGEEYQPPHAHRLRALALGLKIYGKLLSRASFPEEAAFVTDDKVNPHLLLSLPLADIWNRWWEPVLNSRFPLLRFSGFFGLRQAFFNPNFTRWFQGIAGSAWLLGSAVLDDSAYVRELCCQTISELVHHQGDPANTQAYSAIVEALVQLFQRRQEFREANHGIQLFVRMELIWVLANKSQAPFSPCHAEKFLQAAGLLEKFWEVWEFSERRARDQTSESIYRALGAFDGALILSSLFRRPLESACDLSATISSILNYAGEQVESLWPTEDGKLWALCLIPALTGLMENAKVGGVGFIIETLLEVHVQLLCQLVSEPSLRIQLENQVLLMWPSGAYLNKVQVWDATYKLRFEVVYCLLNGLLKLMKVGVMHNVRLDADLIARVVGGHLTGSVACDTHGSVAPTKLLRLGLEVVSNGLVPGLARPCLESTFHDIALRLLLDAGLDAPSFGAVLACMREGLGLVRGGGELAAGLQRRAYDLQWAARDSVVEFVGQLLSGDKPGVKFASDHNLHNILIQAVEDSEPYVRATAYQALARSVANPQLPTEFVQSVESALMEAGRLSLGTLPGELQRRSHLDLLIELLTFHTRHMELPLPSCLPIHSLNGLADDGDTEVVVRAVRLAHAWWNYELAVYTSRQLKRARLEVSAFDFFKLKLDELLIFKLEDASRLVRQAAIEALQKISNDCTSKVAPNWTQDSKLHLEKICSIDFKLHSDCELNLHPDACDLDPLLAPSPEHEPQRPKVNVSKVVDDSGWFTSDSETYDQDDTEDYNVMDCY